MSDAICSSIYYAIICDEIFIDTLSNPIEAYLCGSKYRVDVDPGNNSVIVRDLVSGWITCYRYNDIIKLKMHEIKVTVDQKEGD